MPDTDGDGISNETEDGAPNDGDGNGDGQKDSAQADVGSLLSATGRGFLTVVARGGVGDGCDQLLDVHAVTEDTEGDDPEFAYPFGLVGFGFTDCTSATVSVFFHAASPENPPSIYRKFGLKAPSFVGPPQFYPLPNVIFATQNVPLPAGPSVVTATFTLNDNQLGDGSSLSGVIVDPGGIATSFNTAPVASTMGLVTLVGLLSAVAATRFRPQRRSAPIDRRASRR